MKLYQVLNEDGNPASRAEDNDLAIFKNYNDALEYTHFLAEIGEEGFTIKTIQKMEDITL